MPYPLDTHVLTVDTNVINKIDTSNPQNFYGMWTCAESVEQGRRLENLSWRLWNRETFYCTEDEQASITATSLPSPCASILQDIPQLSGSVDSENDNEAVNFTSPSAPHEIRPRIQRQDSCASNHSQGKERHITSSNFEKMVKETPDLAPASPVYKPPQSTTTESPCKLSKEKHSQKPTSAEITSCTTVVYGFSLSQQTISRPKVVSPAAIPGPRTSPTVKSIQSKKQSISISESYSSSEQGPRFENLRPVLAPKRIFQFGGSSEVSSLNSALSSQSSSLLNDQKKMTSFTGRVSTHTINDNSAITDGSETYYVTESSIDDDDSSDWEDSIEVSNKSSIDEKTFFQRVDSKVNLTSHRSLLTLMIEQNDRSSSKALGNIASQSTLALPWSRTSYTAPPTLAPITKIPRSATQPIYTTASHSQLQTALSPRTTRRNVLAMELTESLRRNLLWERQQKSSTANAVLKRRHTSHDVANLKQYPEKVCLKKGEASPTNNPQFFSKDTDNFGGYHVSDSVNPMQSQLINVGRLLVARYFAVFLMEGVSCHKRVRATNSGTKHKLR
ncbi:DUF1752-domain-containing protein [Colletotrichum falcatum]|nr:DUF1752-domain-containing protein [Colletotrichum falcatum]